MLDIKFIKENPDIIKEAVRKKHLSFDVDELLKVEEQRKAVLATFESLRTEQNVLSDKIPQAADATERATLIENLKPLKEKVQEAEEAVRAVMKEWQGLMLQVPNVPDVSVPEGASDDENVEHSVWGERPTFSFAPKDHVELMEKNDMVDFERGTRVAGFRGYYLKNDAVLLEMALWQYFMASLLRKGYEPLHVPSLVTKNTLYGTGYLPQGEEDLYKTQDDTYLAGTGEVAMMSYHADEVLAATDLPKKYIAMSPCFRREAGSHGKDVKGLIRVHEFFKLEQIILCEANHQTSVAFHEELTKNAEELLQALGLHYHVVVNCGGDLGLGQVKKYDIEVWMPTQEKFRETHSSSYFHDFQTRRLNTRYKDAEGKLHYAHSLNNTLVATPRILACIVENFQEADGRIRVPEVLKPYIGKDYLWKVAMYERTYHKAVLKTDEKPKKKSTRIPWKLIAWIFAIAALLVGLVFVIRMPRFQIQAINVEGAQVVDPGDVTEFVNNHLQGYRLFFLPRSSIFLVPEHRLERELKAAFPRLQAVSVSRGSFSSLTVSIAEYQGVYLWCADDTRCFFMDQNGVVFAPAPYFSGSAYPKIFIGEMQDLPFQAVTSSQLATARLLLSRLPSILITPLEFHFISDHELDVAFNHNGHQAMLLLDPSTDPGAAMEALFTGLRTNPLAMKFHETSQVLEYIDLRFSNRVVYKFQ